MDSKNVKLSFFGSAHVLAVALALATVVPTEGVLAATADPQLSWTTLGTQSGPIPYAERSQLANLLVVKGKPWIVDCGDGAMKRLAAAEFKPAQVDTAFISHLHMDHIGGLQALIGLRWFTGARNMLTITHLGIAGTTNAQAPKLIREAHETFKGEVIVAHDLDRF